MKLKNSGRTRKSKKNAKKGKLKVNKKKVNNLNLYRIKYNLIQLKNITNVCTHTHARGGGCKGGLSAPLPQPPRR